MAGPPIPPKSITPLVWDDLRFFLELARLGSLSAAARALRVDHTTVGRRVQRLETLLGRGLFDRSGGGFALSADGAAILAQAEAMDRAALAVARFGAGTPGLTGTVRITATEALSSRWLAPCLAEFRDRHGEIDIIVLTEDRNLSVARLEADIALRLARPDDSDLIGRRVAVLGYGLYAAPACLDRAPAQHSYVGPSYVGPSYVGYDEGHADLPETGWLRHLAPNARLAFRSNSLPTQAAAIQAGIGMGLLPHYLARGRGDLRQVPVDMVPVDMVPVNMVMERDVWLLVHRDLRDVPRIRVLIDFLTACFERDRTLLAG